MAAVVIAGCGGDDDGGGSEVASIDDVEQCIEDEGLNVSRMPGSEAVGRTDALQVALAEDSNVITVVYHDNEEDAENYEDDAKHFTDQGGGEVKRRGKVVYSVLREGSDEEFKKVEDCL